MPPSPDLRDLLDLTPDRLQDRARAAGLPHADHPWRPGLVAALADRAGAHHGAGVLEVHGEGFGFLRSPYDDFLPGGHDIYVSQSQIKRFALRTGQTVLGQIRPPKEQERYPALLRVEFVDGAPPEGETPAFRDQPVAWPSTRLPLAGDPWLSAVDWLAPLGLGARGLLRGPPGDTRTQLALRMARRLADQDALEVHALLLGSAPEDAEDWRALGREHGAQVVVTPPDESAARHAQVAEIVVERAQRLAERGQEIVLFVDGLSRLLRCYTAEAGDTRQALVDGLHPAASQRLRGVLSAGRDLRDAGSVTLVATLDAGVGDPLSDAADRDLADLATWTLSLRGGAGPLAPRPDLDVARSACRREELLVFGEELARRQRWRAEVGPTAPDERAALDALFQPAALDRSPLDSGSRAGQ